MQSEDEEGGVSNSAAAPAGALSTEDSTDGGSGRGRLGVMTQPPVGKEGYGLKGGAGEYDPLKANGNLGAPGQGIAAEGLVAGREEKRGVFDLPRGEDGQRVGPFPGEDAFLSVNMPERLPEKSTANGPLEGGLVGQPERTQQQESGFKLPADKALPFASLNVSVGPYSEPASTFSPIPASEPIPAFKDAAVSRAIVDQPLAGRQVAVPGSLLGSTGTAPGQGFGGQGFGGLEARAGDLGCNEEVPVEDMDSHASIENLLESLMSQDGGHSCAGNHINDGAAAVPQPPPPPPVTAPIPQPKPQNSNVPKQQWAGTLEAGRVAQSQMPASVPSGPVAQRSSPFQGLPFNGPQLPQGYTLFPAPQGLSTPQIVSGPGSIRPPQPWLSGAPLGAKSPAFVPPIKEPRDGLYAPQAARGGLVPQGGGSAFAAVGPQGSGRPEGVSAGPRPATMLQGQSRAPGGQGNSSDEEVPISQMGEKRRPKVKKLKEGGAAPKQGDAEEKPKKKRVKKPKAVNGEADKEGPVGNGVLAGVKQGDLPKKKRKPVVKKPAEGGVGGQGLGFSDEAKEGEENGPVGGASGASTPDGKRVIKKTQRLLEGEESKLFRLPSIQGSAPSSHEPKTEAAPGKKKERKKAAKTADGEAVKKPRRKKPSPPAEGGAAEPTNEKELPPPASGEASLQEEGPIPTEVGGPIHTEVEAQVVEAREASPGPFDITMVRRKRSDVTPKKRFDSGNLDVALSVPFRKKRSQNDPAGQNKARKKRKTLPLAVQEALQESEAEQEVTPEPEPEPEPEMEVEAEPESFNKDRCT